MIFCFAAGLSARFLLMEKLFAASGGFKNAWSRKDY